MPQECPGISVFTPVAVKKRPFWRLSIPTCSHISPLGSNWLQVGVNSAAFSGMYRYEYSSSRNECPTIVPVASFYPLQVGSGSSKSLFFPPVGVRMLKELT